MKLIKHLTNKQHLELYVEHPKFDGYRILEYNLEFKNHEYQKALKLAWLLNSSYVEHRVRRRKYRLIYKKEMSI